jgi:probable rRNA maturation factor
MQVSVSYGLPEKGLPDEDAFQQWAAAALEANGGVGEVSIRVVDAPEGHELNLRYRHKDYPTNVLSFRAELPPGLKIPLLGDLVLCAPVIEKEAREQRKGLEEHYAHLVVHGVLHLIGHDHETIAEARRMEALETQVLEKMGIPDPYIARD